MRHGDPIAVHWTKADTRGRITRGRLVNFTETWVKVEVDGEWQIIAWTLITKVRLIT